MGKSPRKQLLNNTSGMLKKNKIVPNIIESSSQREIYSTSSKTSLRSPPSPTPLPSTTHDSKRRYVEIFIKAKSIISADMFSKTDPLVVVHVKRYGKWFEYCRTETIINCMNPTFVETFCVDTSHPDNRRLKITLYDADNLNSKDLQKCKFLGSAEVETNLLHGEAYTELRLTQESGAAAGFICLCAVHVQSTLHSKKEAHLSIGASKLTKKNFFNRADVFLEVSREIFEGTYHPVYRSEIIFKTNGPRWKLFTINMQKLCNGDTNQNIFLKVWGHNVKGEPELKGQLLTTLSFLLQQRGLVKQISLQKPAPASKRVGSFRRKEKEPNIGYLKLYHVSLDEQYSLADYLSSDVQIHSSIAIDFTLSNGFPFTHETSLHHLDRDGNNDYVMALNQIGTWLSYYCKCIPLVGFGGKMHTESFLYTARNSKTFIESELQKLIENNTNDKNNNNEDNGGNEDVYCFEINKSNPDMEAIISSYRETLPLVEPGGPTYFKKVLQKLYTNTTPVRDRNNDLRFSIVLLLTDGVSNDEEELEKYLLTLMNQPVIVVIAGVGPCSFTPTLHLVNRVNRKVNRKLLFFHNTSMNFNRVSSHASESIKELYVTISKAVVAYFVKRQIHPKKVAEGPFLDADYGSPFEFGSRASSPLCMDTKKTCCPTCGSFVNLSAMPY